MRVTASRRLEWDSAHRVLRHESKCAHLHGHRYVAEIVCEADELDSVGRVIDFGVLKSVVGTWIDRRWDHATLVNAADAQLRGWVEEHGQDHYVFDGEPTAENIAAELMRVADDLVGTAGLSVVRVRVWETPNCYAEAEA